MKCKTCKEEILGNPKFILEQMTMIGYENGFLIDL